MVSTQERTVHQRDHLYGAYFHFQQANEWPSAPRCPTFTPRLFGAWDGTTVKDARGGSVEVRVRFQVHRRARSVSDIPRAHSATARRSRCIVRIGIGGIFARIDSIRSGGGRGGGIEGGAGGRRSRRERCTRDMYTPRPRTGCTTRIPPRWPCARRFRVTASAAGRRTTAA